MDHSWFTTTEYDVDLPYSVSICRKCGTRFPSTIDLAVVDFSSFGVSPDCDVQLIKSVVNV